MIREREEEERLRDRKGEKERNVQIHKQRVNR